MKCWDCGQELDTTQIENDAASMERMRIYRVVDECAEILREKGDLGWRAVDALREALHASRGL